MPEIHDYNNCDDFINRACSLTSAIDDNPLWDGRSCPLPEPETMPETPTLTPNQIKQLELIRSAIINIHDSPEFARFDYYPDLTLADAVQAIQELLIECEREKPNKPVMHLTIARRFSLTRFLSKAMIASFFTTGCFACAALFSCGVNSVNQVAPKNPLDLIDWQDAYDVASGLTAISLAISASCALGAVAMNQRALANFLDPHSSYNFYFRYANDNERTR